MKKNSFVEGTIIATVAIIIVKILGMFYMVPFYATVGSQGSALYSYAYVIYAVFLEISSVGLPIAVSKIINEYNTLGMLDAKVRAYKIGKRMVTLISVVCFILLFVFAKELAYIFVGNLDGGNTIEDVAFVIRSVSFALLVIPYLSITKGYLQGHKFISPASVSNVIEQIARIFVIITGSYMVIKLLGSDKITLAVGVAVFGAFVGGLIACFYLLRKMRKNKDLLSLGKIEKKDKVSNKEIFKKILSYAIPFIIINVATSIYSLINVFLIKTTLNNLGTFKASDIEFINSAITTLGSKLNMIVGSIAAGMTVSLIPTIVSSFVKEDWTDVKSKINRAFQIVIFVSIPMTVGLSLLAKPVWTAFYGVSHYGPIIFKFSVWIALFGNLYMISGSILQGLNKFKAVYLSTLLGFCINAILDVPLMIMFDYFDIHAFYGAILSTIIGYTLSVLIATSVLKKEHGISLKDTIFKTLKMLIPTFIMAAVILLLRFVPYNVDSRLSSILFIALNTIIGAIIYIVIAFKMGLLDQIFGRLFMNKIIKKLTFGKVSRES